MATGTAVDVVAQMGVSRLRGRSRSGSSPRARTSRPTRTSSRSSTDKVDASADATGVVQQILAQEGETVAVGTKIAVIAPEGAARPRLRRALRPSRPPRGRQKRRTPPPAERSEAATEEQAQEPPAPEVWPSPRRSLWRKRLLHPSRRLLLRPEPAAAAAAPAEDEDGRGEAKFINPRS